MRRTTWIGWKPAIDSPRYFMTSSWYGRLEHPLLTFSRRTFVGAAAAAALTVTGQAFAAAPTRVILLGSKGGPSPSPSRAPACVAIVIGGSIYLVDCPNGVARQIVMAGLSLDRLSQVFITHNHSDHVLDVGSLLVLAWGSGLKSAVGVHGPSPLRKIVAQSLAASSYDIAARMREEGRPPLKPLIHVHEQESAGPVFRDATVTVSCTAVDHYTVRPALAYRFDTPTRSIVISGDTTCSDALVDLARDADLLIHEAMYADGIDQLASGNTSLREHLLRSHSTTEQVGMVAARAGVKKLVLSHLVPAFPTITDEMWLTGVRKYFSGEAIVGRDLLEV